MNKRLNPFLTEEEKMALLKEELKELADRYDVERAADLVQKVLKKNKSFVTFLDNLL